MSLHRGVYSTAQVWYDSSYKGVTQGTMVGSTVEHSTILVVDDEEPIVDLVSSYLAVEGYHVHQAHDGLSALHIARSTPIDLVILDVMLPGMDGIEVCRHLLTETSSYILMLTARSDEVDKLIGLSIGADDYMTKPFSPRELVARVKAILRRGRGRGRDSSTVPAPSVVVRVGRLQLDPSRREVHVDNQPIELTPREFDLLHALARQPGHVFTREGLLEQVWGNDFDGIDRVVDVHIGTLRRKLGAAAGYIQTIRGVGYKLAGEPA